MKNFFVVIPLVFLLLGCSSNKNGMAAVMELRETMLHKNCTFDSKITADYGEYIYEFEMACQGDTQGNLMFSVDSPETIAGVSGTLHATGGKLVFDDTVLAIELLADGEVSPVSAPWILLYTLQSGYIAMTSEDENGICVSIHDTYEEDALVLDVWLNQDGIPYHAEILWQGRRVLTIRIENFQFL